MSKNIRTVQRVQCTQFMKAVLLPEIFSNKNQYRNIQHQYETRSNESRHTRQYKTNKRIGQRSFKYITLRLVNQLPTDLQEKENIEISNLINGIYF